MEVVSDDEKSIKSWLQNNSDKFNYIDLNKSSVNVQTDTSIWNNNDIPPNISHPSVEFLSNPALVLSYNYTNQVQNEATIGRTIPEDYLNFNSTPGQAVDPTFAENVIETNPAKIILPLNNFTPILDSRTPSKSEMKDENIVTHPELSYYTFEFESINAQFDLITPIILSLYIFDASIGRRVSEQWTIVPEQFKSKLSEDQEFNNIINSPQKASFAISRPRITKSQNLTDQLFLVVVLDRPFILKGGAAVDDFYENPKEANKKKAIQATKERCNGGWSNTFAYGAIPISNIVNQPGSDRIIFDHVVATQQADEEYLQHKLNKVRKNPVNYAIEVKYKMSLTDPNDKTVQKMNELYPLFPFFNLHYEEKLLIKLKTVVLNLKIGQKGKNIAAVIKCLDGTTPLNIINGKSMIKTRCQYHCTQPMFQEDIILSLPHPITPTMQVTFQFYHLPSKKKKGDIKLCGEGSFPLLAKENGLMRPNGEYKIPLRVDPKMVDVKENSKSFAVVDLELNSYLNSSHVLMNEILSGTFVNLKTIFKLDDIVSFLPPILDVIFNRISNNDRNAFIGLLTVLHLIPIDQYDTRFIALNKEQDNLYMPDRHLSFYAKYAALRGLNVDQFFKIYVNSWLELSKEQVSAERQDIVSCPFMLEVLLKCIYLKKEFIYANELTELIFNLQKAVYSVAIDNQTLGLRLNTFLALFYKDLMEFCDRGRVFFFVHYHLSYISTIRTNVYQQIVFADFLSAFFSVKSFLYSLIPVRNNDPLSCFFARDIIILIEEGLSTIEHTSNIFTTLFNCLIRFTYSDIKLLAPSLFCLLVIVGRNWEILQKSSQTKTIIIIFALLLILVCNVDLKELNVDIDNCCLFLLRQSNDYVIKNEPQAYTIVQQIGNYGYKNSFVLETSSPPAAEVAERSPIFVSNYAWKKFSFIIQLIFNKFATLSDSIHILNYMMIPLFDINVSSSLFSQAKSSMIGYIKTNSTLIFTSPYSRIYKLIHYVMKNASSYNVELIDELWKIEKSLFNTNNRCRAFTLRAMYKFKLNESHIPIFSNSCILELLTEYVNMMKQYTSFDINDPNNHENIADLLLKIAEYFRPSPDTRVDVLLELAEYHVKSGYKTEAAISQLTACAIVAEYLKVLEKVPDVFHNNQHPANLFKICTPSAGLEVCPESILSDLPKIPGFCSSHYFTQCGMIYLILLSFDTCKRYMFYELSTKVHSLLRPIAQPSNLWKILEKHYHNGSFSWQALEQFATKDREFSNYYRVEFQDNGTYIYRESSFANLWQVSEKLKEKAKYYSQGKPVVILNDGDGLATAKIEADKYYVHVKAVEQYFTNQEKSERITAFDQNYNVLKFYFDIPYSKDAQQSIEYLMLKRTIYTINHPIPYIVSRVQVPPENIEKILFSPIEFSCESLQKQVDKINDAANNGNYVALQPLIQGSLLTQVNEGPKRMAEVFLTGATENEFTLRLRKIFREFLKVNSEAVKLHGEWVVKNPAFMTLQEELELGLNRLTSTLQPFLK